MRSAWVRTVIAGVLALALALPAHAAPSKPRVAVMELEDRTGQLPQTLRRELTEYFRGLLVASGTFVVIDAARQSEALERLVRERKRDSYRPCVDDACQIPLGKVLSADSIVRLSVARIGGTYVVNAERVDLASEASAGGAVVKCAADPARGRPARLLAALDEVAAALGGGGGGAARPGAAAATAGLRWIALPSGIFRMGWSEGNQEVRPVHEVYLDAFEMLRTEVTVGQYRDQTYRSAGRRWMAGARAG